MVQNKQMKNLEPFSLLSNQKNEIMPPIMGCKSNRELKERNCLGGAKGEGTHEEIDTEKL